MSETLIVQTLRLSNLIFLYLGVNEKNPRFKNAVPVYLLSLAINTNIYSIKQHTKQIYDIYVVLKNIENV